MISHIIIAAMLMTSPDSTLRVEPENHSFSRPNEAAVKHLDFDLTVDFSSKKLSGKANLYFQNITATNKLYLDTRDLIIKQVTLGQKHAKTHFTIGDPVEHLGQSLTIDIQPDTKFVTVLYETKPEAAALQWLEPAQTAGGRQPFLFTQSQAILARTWVPCQDNPGVRMTYRAKIRVPRGMMAVMSAENGTKKTPNGVYEFYMPQPIPSYLLALAVGDIEFRRTGERTGVYAEPAVVDKAAWEFADAENMIATAEKLYGPYRWGRYDVIVLPPSFPFGGMENPRLTFATPTVIAGDRSLIALVAHELAHSWSGNLVTNATWNDFWLNEGFTVYFERRILEALYGRDYAEMRALLGFQDLQETMTELGPDSADTKLYLNLKGRDPDDGVTDIPYEKGYLFLRLLEEKVGRDTWDVFLRGYFAKFAFQTMTTPAFLSYLREQLIKGNTALEDSLQIEKWVNGTGLPGNCPHLQSISLQKANAQIQAWADGTMPKDLQTSDWTSPQWQHFIRNLPATLNSEQMSALNDAFHFTESGNAEILQVWFERAIKSNYTTAYPAMENFLTHVGRRKLVKPLYTKMAATPEGLEMAKRIYGNARPGYHAVTVHTIDDILHWKQ